MWNQAKGNDDLCSNQIESSKIQDKNLPILSTQRPHIEQWCVLSGFGAYVKLIH